MKIKELELQTLPGLAAENATLLLDVSRLKNPVKTLSRKSDLVFPLVDEVRDLRMSAEFLRANAEAVKQQNIELEGEVLLAKDCPMVDPVRERTLLITLQSVKSKLAASRVKCANARWDAGVSREIGRKRRGIFRKRLPQCQMKLLAQSSGRFAS